MLKLTQKTATIDGKIIAFVEPLLCIGEYTYKFSFDERTRKRINKLYRSLGFVVGSVSSLDDVLHKEVELPFAPCD